MKWRVVEVREKCGRLSAMWSIKKCADLSDTRFCTIYERPTFARLLAEAQAKCDEYNKREALGRWP